MRIAVTGASGLVGRALVRRLGATGFGHRDLDITDAASVQRTVGDFDLVINCAVISVDACERDPALARAVNVDGPANLARAARSILHFSTNYVFDGTEEKLYSVDDSPRPINVYGKTKLEGERAVAEECRDAYIVRSSWIFGPGKESFVSSVPRWLRAGEHVRAAADIFASATYVVDLVEGVAAILERRQFGLHHIVNAGVCSNATFALEAARIAGADPQLVEPVSTGDVHSAPRPRYTPLLASQPLRDWREALAAYIRSSP